MGIIRSCLIAFIILICVSPVDSSSFGEESEEVLFGDRIDLRSWEIDEDMARLLWINCRLHLIQAKEATEEFDLYVMEDKLSNTNGFISGSQSLSKENILKTINILDPHRKQTLLGCLREKYSLFRVSGEESVSKNWYTKYLDSLFARLDVPRRYLNDQLLLSNTQNHLLVGSAEAPTPSLAPDPSSSEDPPASPQVPFFPPSTSASLQPSAGGTSSSGSNASSNKSNNNNKSVVVAVVVTAIVTFSGVALFFYCYRRAHRTGSEVRRNDERPLLSLSLSDFSVGPYPKTFAVGNSVDKEKLANQALGTNPDPKRVSSLDGSLYIDSDILNMSLAETQSLGVVPVVNMSSNTNTEAPLPPLKPPPGRVVSPNPGFLPLKPPPGRLEALPPEPPASRKPPPGRATPPPPPPPVPPPSLQPSSGSTAPPPPGHPSLPPKPPGIRPGPPLQPPPRSNVPPTPQKSGVPQPPSMSDIAPPPPRSSVPPPPPRSGVPPPPPRSGVPPPPPTSGTPPPPPRIGVPPPPPKSGLPAPPRPPPSLSKANQPPNAPGEGASSRSEAYPPKTKLKPFFWDKVLANPDHSMVWHQIKSGSFQFNEEMIETLFGYTPPEKTKTEHKRESSAQDSSSQNIQLIDPKKSHNLGILLKSWNVKTEEICDALQEGNELPVELLQLLLSKAPTAEEELKLRLFNGDLCQLGLAERFLKALVDIPFAFKRLESLVFMSSLQEEISMAKESFATLETACKALRSSRLFLKLLEAVLKTGNRMNDGTFRGGAQAFKLDTLLKLADVKGIDGKTTLLHFVVLEIIRSEGVRAVRVARESKSFTSIKSDDLLEDPSQDSEEHYRTLGLQVVSGLSGELENVKKAAVLDTDGLTGMVGKVGNDLQKTRAFLKSDIKNLDEQNGFRQTLESFLQHAEIDIMWLLEEEKRIMALVKSTTDYFHGNAAKDEGLRLFVIVRDFLIMLDKVCKEVKDAPARFMPQKKEVPTGQPSDPRQPQPQPAFPDIRQKLFPAIVDRRMDSSSSDDDSP